MNVQFLSVRPTISFSAVEKRFVESSRVHLRRPPVLTPREIEVVLPVSAGRLVEWMSSSSRPLIQDAFPDLSSEQREILLTGLLPGEWDALFRGSPE